MSEQIGWRHVLTCLAAHQVNGQPVHFEKQCMGRRLQWAQAKNIWQNATIRSLLYAVARPFRAS